MKRFYHFCARILGWSLKIHPGDQEWYYFNRDSRPVWGRDEWRPFIDRASTKWFLKYWFKVVLFGIFCGLYTSFLLLLIFAGGMATMYVLLRLMLR